MTYNYNQNIEATSAARDQISYYRNMSLDLLMPR